MCSLVFNSFLFFWTEKALDAPPVQPVSAGTLTASLQRNTCRTPGAADVWIVSAL